MKPERRRIDQLLTDRGLAPSREKARALLLAGSVRVNNQRIDKPGTTVALDAAIEIAESMPYVSRGGYKLAAALDHFHVNPSNRVCLDIGSSTGGFTDCLLQRGAARVHSIDVGHGQLDWKIRNHPAVVIHEGLNARFLQLSDLGEPVSLAVCDVSFISVTLILPVLPPMLTPPGEIVILVKPQFEVGRTQVGRGGIVREPSLHQAACDKVQASAAALGFENLNIIPSPILGAEGNREFLLYGRHPHHRHHH